MKGHRVVRCRGSHICLDSQLTDGGKVVSHMHQSPFTPRKIPDTHFKNNNNDYCNSPLSETFRLSLRMALQLRFACCFCLEWVLIFAVFCVQNGHIFVFTGILNLCTNDDQLCVILAHEISHVLLSHMVS
jgi:Zn-dependent protease with chaperone function